MRSLKSRNSPRAGRQSHFNPLTVQGLRQGAFSVPSLMQTTAVTTPNPHSQPSVIFSSNQSQEFDFRFSPQKDQWSNVQICMFPCMLHRLVSFLHMAFGFLVIHICITCIVCWHKHILASLVLHVVHVGIISGFRGCSRSWKTQACCASCISTQGPALFAAQVSGA